MYNGVCFQIDSSGGVAGPVPSSLEGIHVEFSLFQTHDKYSGEKCLIIFSYHCTHSKTHYQQNQSESGWGQQTPRSKSG